MTFGKFSFLTSCLLLTFSSVSLADNGSVAYAYPISNITIDGDLSDWPADIEAFEFQRGRMEKADLNAVFRVGYHLESDSIFVAVEVVDDSFVPGELSSRSWTRQDSHLLYIDMDHSKQSSAALLFGAWANRTVYIAAVGSWDPKADKGHNDMVDMVQKRTNGKTIYEWRVQTGAKIRPGTTIGFDHLLNDVDIDKDGEQSQTSTLWGNLYAKSYRASRLGDLILMDPNQKTGTLRGSMRWHESVIGMRTGHRRIRIQSKENPLFWLQPRLDGSGHFEIDLPVGRYLISTPHLIYGNRNQYRIKDGLNVRAQVKAGKTSNAKTLVLKTMAPPDVGARKELLFSYKPGDEPKVDRFIKANMSYYQVPGASISLVLDGKQVYSKNFGVANVYTGDPITNQTLFEAGSVTKIAFAFAVHRLTERGVIDLDQPLHEILPFEDIAHDDRYRLITARHVLSHQTGFPNWARFNNGKVDIQFKPGTGFRYSGEAFEWLGRVVSFVTRKNLETVLEEETLKPMGFVKNTCFSDQGQLMGNTAFAHIVRTPRIPNYPKQVGVAWSMHTNANALSPFMISLMARKGLSAKSYEGILTPKVGTTEDWDLKGLGWKTQFSLGFQIRETPFGITYGHGGSNDGNECVFEIFDEKDAGFIVMTNGDTGREFFEAFRRFLVTGK